jgi:DNA repair protein RadB
MGIKANDVTGSLIEKYRFGHLTTIYGNAASGKTTSCLLAAIQAEGKVIYVDTENGFDTQRLSQLYSGDVEKLLENIFLLQPKSFEEQHETILKLHKLCDNPKIKLVIVDTIGNRYRKVVNENPEESNTMMIMQMQILYRIARDLNKAVILANQVYASLKDNKLRMIGGAIVRNMSNCIIELEKKDDRRFATLMKYKLDKGEHHHLGKTVEFEISEKGLVAKP